VVLYSGLPRDGFGPGIAEAVQPDRVFTSTGIAPCAFIGGCDPPQPVSNATAAQLLSAQRPKSKLFNCCSLFRKRTGESNASIY
jgi:hypothetical protein